MSRIIYHYCSMDTFNIIMKNKTIRLSDITKSNDSLEKILIYDHLESSVNHAFEKMLRIPVKANTPIETDFVGNRSYLDFFKKDLEDMNSQCSLVTCFSRNGDLLSQWRGYANDGCGFAIGFDHTLLEKYLKRDDRFRVQIIEQRLAPTVNKL